MAFKTPKPVVYETDPSVLTRQLKEIDPSVKSVTYSRSTKTTPEAYTVNYASGTTRTLTPEGMANLQKKYLVNPQPMSNSEDWSFGGYSYTPFYGAVTPEDIAKFSKGYVAPDAVAEEAPKSTTIQPETLAAITPFTPTVPAFTRQGGAPYAGLAALPARAPVSLIQMPTAAPVLAPSVQTIGPGGPVAGMKKGGLASIAQDLASKGRYGDTMVAHISPQEAGILKALGGSGTINPETGLPEFFLDKIFKAVLPAAAGYFLGPAGAGLFSSGVTAGLTVGGLTAAATGSLEKGLAAGLGAYGGFGLSEGVAAASTAAEQEVARQATLGTGTGTVGSGAGGVSSGTVGTDFVGPTATGVPPTAGGYSFGNEGEFLVTGSEGVVPVSPTPSTDYMIPVSQRAANVYGVPGVSNIPASTTSALTPMEAFTDKVGMGTAGSLYAGSVALPAAIEETEKLQRQQALIRAEEEEKERMYRELFASTLGAVPTRGRAGGLMSLAGGGMTYMEAGGTTGPTGAPRDVTGTGDGMSDSVPATIEGVQEARLADGEFVVPADVVADIGNGSSDAGSKKLYDMMDRIRKARHGTTEQPPEIDAEALMPA